MGPQFVTVSDAGLEFGRDEPRVGKASKAGKLIVGDVLEVCPKYVSRIL